MLKKKLKTPADYPQFYCRMQASDKEEIEELLEKILIKANERRADDEHKPKRNDYVAAGLKRGLRSLLRDFNTLSDKGLV